MLAAKTLTATAAAAMVATIALTTNGVDAGTVSLYEHTYHQGRSIKFDIWSTEQCYNVGCFNDIASSARWAGLTPGYKVFFFTDINCKGRNRGWYTTEPHHPSSFAFDGINDQVTSVLVAKSADQVFNGNVQVCSFPQRADVDVAGGNASEPAVEIQAAVVAVTPAPTVLAVEGH